MDGLIGQDVGRYHIIERLGEGGNAVVFKAFDTRLERVVAVKFIRTDLFGKTIIERLLTRFEREAKALARLNHPNIVKVYDYGEHEGMPYLVMEYLPGGTLKQRLGKAMPAAEAARLLLPVARALGYAHDHQLLHRDVKPANILITESGEPILTDFGIAKVLDDSDGNTLTGTGVGIGTPEYMAPEQGLGGEVDARADVYALGVVLYEMVTGRKPFQADTPLAVLYKQMNDPLPPPRSYVPGLPESVEQVLFKALAKRREDRYQDMGSFTTALERLASGVEIAPGPAAGQRDADTMLEVSPQNLSGASTQAAQTVARLAPVMERPVPNGRPGLPKLLLAGGGLLALLVVTAVIIAVLRPGAKAPGAALAEATQTSTLGATLMPVIATLPPQASPATTVYAASETPRPTDTLAAAAAAAYGQGSLRVRAVDQMLQVYVPAGEFIMGAQDSAKVTNKDERPAHSVTLDAFWLDQSEVTNQQYALCVQAGACQPPRSARFADALNYYATEKFAAYPVINVDWGQAAAYCQWVGARLPSEAEWEKAARGTDGASFPWGEQKPNALLANIAYYYDRPYIAGALPLGASPYGALDMLGNVWEWTANWYNKDDYASSAAANPAGPESGTARVIRGMGWADKFDDARVTVRSAAAPATANSLIGFRCATSPDPQSAAAYQVVTATPTSIYTATSTITPTPRPTKTRGPTKTPTWTWTPDLYAATATPTYKP